jgi:hypothetical protein
MFDIIVFFWSWWFGPNCKLTFGIGDILHRVLFSVTNSRIRRAISNSTAFAAMAMAIDVNVNSNSHTQWVLSLFSTPQSPHKHIENPHPPLYSHFCILPPPPTTALNTFIFHLTIYLPTTKFISLIRFYFHSFYTFIRGFFSIFIFNVKNAKLQNFN